MSRAGESLIEVIIAVSILGTTLPLSAGMVMRANLDTTQARNDLIARNLAEEGTEIFESFRIENELRFSAKSSECWNTKPEWNEVDGCENNSIKAGVYRIGRNGVSGKWELTRSAGDAALSENLGNEAFFRLYTDSATGMYVHEGQESPGAARSESNFYRELKVETGDADGDGVDDELFATSRVSYPLGVRIRTLKRTAHVAAR